VHVSRFCAQLSLLSWPPPRLEPTGIAFISNYLNDSSAHVRFSSYSFNEPVTISLVLTILWLIIIQLRDYVSRFGSKASFSLHGCGILGKLSQAANPVADVLLLVPRHWLEWLLQRE
jgi:hypothetical protein